MDGPSHKMGAGVGLKIKAPTREMIEQTMRLDLPASNNETEYEAILDEIDLAKSVSSEKLIIRNESQDNTKRETNTWSSIKVWSSNDRRVLQLGSLSISRRIRMKRQMHWPQ